MNRTVHALIAGAAVAFLGTSLGASLGTPAVAADLPASSLAPVYKAPAAVAEGWTVSLGAEGRWMPAYPGADRMEVNPFPVIEIRRTGTPRRFSAPRDGLSLALFDTNTFRVGAVGKLMLDRREKNHPELRGLGNVDYAVEIGGFAEFFPVPWLRGRAEVRQGFGGHHGVFADFSADAIARVTPQLTLSAGPRLTVASDRAVTPYFSVSPGQSILSGLPTYDAKGGLYSYGAGAQVRYDWTQRIETHVFVEYERLTDSVANAPLVTQRGSRDQVTVGFGASYAFDIPALIPGIF